MKVALVTDFYYPWTGGPSTLIRNLARGLSDRGHEVFLLAPSADGKPGEQHEGAVVVTRARTAPLPFGYGVRLALPLAQTSRWLGRVKPDVVHIHHPFPLSASAALAARSAGLPLVATNHTIPECSLWGLRERRLLYPAAHAAFARWLVALLRQCHTIVTPTETAARLLRSLGFNHPVIPISNGIDTSRFSPGLPPDHLRRRFGLDDRPAVLYTGRLDAEKQIEVWLRAAARASERVDAQFIIGGEGTAKPNLERLAQQLGIQHRTRFIGYLDEEDYPAIYRLAQVYMMMSPVELQSISTLEAVASGLPVVAVKAGALPELVGEQNGHLTERGDWIAAGDALASILSSDAVRRDMGEQSRKCALGHDMRRSVEQYESILEATIAVQRGTNRSRRAGWATR